MRRAKTGEPDAIRCYNPKVYYLASMPFRLPDPVLKPITCVALCAAIILCSNVLLSAAGKQLEPPRLSGTITLKQGVAADFAVSSNGNLYVSNAATHRVDVYDKDGHSAVEARPPVDQADFFEPGAIAAEGDDAFWVFDSFSGKVFRFFSDGNLLGSFALDAGDTHILSVSEMYVVAQVKPAPPDTAPSAPGSDAPGKTASTKPVPKNGFAGGPDTGLLFVQRGDGVISVFDLSGNWGYNLGYDPPGGIPTPAGLYVSYPQVFALDGASKTLISWNVSNGATTPSTIILDDIPDGAPAVGLSGLDAGSLLILCGGDKVLFAGNPSSGFTCVLAATPAGPSPPSLCVSGRKIYILNRDSGMVEIYEVPARDQNAPDGGS